MGLQFAVGALILKTRGGEWLFNRAQAMVVKFIGFADGGNALVFGALAQR